MKLEHIIALIVRLFSIVLVVYALRNGITFVPFLYGQGDLLQANIFAGLMVSILIIAIVLWKFPLTVARNLVAFREPGNIEIESVSENQIQVVAFSVLGLYFLFYVVSDIVYWFYLWLVSQRDPEIPMEFSIDQKGQMVSTAIEFVFVLFLLLGSKRIAELLRKSRYGKDT
jgi:hypothetical protein